MLMAHQSSIEDDFIRFSLLSKLSNNDNKWLEKFYKNQKAWKNYSPGENVFYTNQGFNILGLVIEKVTNQSYLDYCQKYIFEPLQMYNTSFSFLDYRKDQLACLYFWILGLYIKGPYLHSPDITLPCGGVKSTVPDMSNFLIMHMNGGIYNGVRILNEESVNEMHKVQYPGSFDDGIYSYGFGWDSKTTDDGETFGGHNGRIQGARTDMKMRYSDKVGIIFFWNQHSYTRIFFRQVLPEEKEARLEIEHELFMKADQL
jgi:CubicO group peptidase (beta-lactamase class C family)